MRLSRLTGYQLVKARKNHFTLLTHLSVLFRRLRINCVIDVGANVGQCGQALRRFGYEGRIVSFEPVSDSFRRLQAACRQDPHWIAQHCALGAVRDTRAINVTRETPLASFHPLTRYATDRFKQGRPEVLRTEEVRVATIDDVFDEAVRGIDDPRVFLKMDTQGHDLEVVRGAGPSLARILALQSELSVIPVYHGIPDYVSALRSYRDLGFAVTGFYPVLRDRSSLVLVEFDCVMQRQGGVRETSPIE